MCALWGWVEEECAMWDMCLSVLQELLLAEESHSTLVTPGFQAVLLVMSWEIHQALQQSRVLQGEGNLFSSYWWIGKEVWKDSGQVW